MNKECLVELFNVGIKLRQKKGLLRHEYFWAIKNISFKILIGETLGIIGSNGAGKSTLLSLLSGIISPDLGQIYYGKKDFSASLLSLNLGFVGQLTGRENIFLGGLLLGMSRSEVNEKTEDIIKFSDLGPFIDKPFYTYSSGMRARLGFSVAIYSNPDLILVDEVLGVGDLGFREKASKAITNLMLSEKTVVLVSHNINIVREHCNRVVWLENGSIRAIGLSSNILPDYENYFKTRSN